MNYLQRKKRAFISILNGVKGFVKSISGIPPITLEDCVDEKSVINYQIYGDSTQDSEPTPDAPVDVVSVGEKTKNLFDESLLLTESSVTKVEDGYRISAYPTQWGGTSNLVTHLKKLLKPNITYTLSRRHYKEATADTMGSAGSIRIKGSNNSNLVSLSYTYASGISNQEISFSLTQEQIDSITGVWIYGHASKEIVFHYIQLEEGDTATDREPYGYKIPVTASGRNLLNEDLFLEESNWTFTDAGDIGKFYLTPVGLDIGKKYTIVSKCTKSLSMSIYKGSTFLKGLGDGNYTQFTYSDDIYLRIYVGSTNGAKNNYYKVRDYYQLMIVEGAYTDTTIGEYEPYVEPVTTNIYVNEPLRKVGDYADYVDFKSGKLYRKIGAVNLYANIGWTKGTSPTGNGMYRNYFSKTNFYGGEKVPGFSNVLPVSKQTWNNWSYPQFHFGQKNVAIYLITDKQMTTNQEIWDFISNNGTVTPYLLFWLATLTEETIDLSQLPTFKGTTIYTIETNTQPSNMVVDYYSTTKGE